MSKGRGFVMSGGTYQGEEVQGRGAKAYAPRVPGRLIIRPLSGPCGGAYAIRPYMYPANFPAPAGAVCNTPLPGYKKAGYM